MTLTAVRLNDLTGEKLTIRTSDGIDRHAVIYPNEGMVLVTGLANMDSRVFKDALSSKIGNRVATKLLTQLGINLTELVAFFDKSGKAIDITKRCCGVHLMQPALAKVVIAYTLKWRADVIDEMQRRPEVEYLDALNNELISRSSVSAEIGATAANDINRLVESCIREVFPTKTAAKKPDTSKPDTSNTQPAVTGLATSFANMDDGEIIVSSPKPVVVSVPIAPISDYNNKVELAETLRIIKDDLAADFVNNAKQILEVAQSLFKRHLAFCRTSRPFFGKKEPYVVENIGFNKLIKLLERRRRREARVELMKLLSNTQVWDYIYWPGSRETVGTTNLAHDINFDLTSIANAAGKSEEEFIKSNPELLQEYVNLIMNIVNDYTDDIPGPRDEHRFINSLPQLV